MKFAYVYEVAVQQKDGFNYSMQVASLKRISKTEVGKRVTKLLKKDKTLPEVRRVGWPATPILI